MHAAPSRAGDAGVFAPIALPGGEGHDRRMIEEESIAGGLVHELPQDLRKALELHPKALATWQDISPIARNEWICWIESPKKPETRRKRIDWGCSSLSEGKRRPCCWPGCKHR